MGVCPGIMVWQGMGVPVGGQCSCDGQGVAVPGGWSGETERAETVPQAARSRSRAPKMLSTFNCCFHACIRLTCFLLRLFLRDISRQMFVFFRSKSSLNPREMSVCLTTLVGVLSGIVRARSVSNRPPSETLASSTRDTASQANAQSSGSNDRERKEEKTPRSCSLEKRSRKKETRHDRMVRFCLMFWQAVAPTHL